MVDLLLAGNRRLHEAQNYRVEVTTAVSTKTDLPDLDTGTLRVMVSEWGARTTVGFEGEWDLSEQEKVRDSFRRALARQPDCLVVDFSRLSFIDSSGVHVTTELARRTARLNIELEIIPGPRAVQRIFEICHLTERLPFIMRH